MRWVDETIIFKQIILHEFSLVEINLVIKVFTDRFKRSVLFHLKLTI